MERVNVCGVSNLFTSCSFQFEKCRCGVLVLALSVKNFIEMTDKLLYSFWPSFWIEREDARGFFVLSLIYCSFKWEMKKFNKQ
jgi:hypothetical protein